MRTIRSLILILLFMGLSACTPHVTGLQHDNSFNYDAVVNGGLAVAGVSATFTEFPAGQKNQLAEVFRREIIDKREEYRVLAPGVLEQQLGEKYSGMLDNFRESGVLGPNDLTLLKEKKIPSRYLLLARIEKHDSRQNRNDTPVYDGKGNQTNKAHVSLKSIGEVSAYSNIYDLHRSISVWSGSITQSITKENSFEAYKGSSFKKALEDAAVGVLLGNKAAGREYPEEPSFDAVARKVFRGFASNLPKKKK